MFVQKDFEKIYSKLDTFMKDKNATDNDMDALIKEFINQYKDVPETILDEALAKFDEALNTDRIYW